MGAPLGKDVTLDCHTEAYPMSINYWAKEGGEMIINDAKYDTSTKEKNYKVHMKLAIKTLEEQDFGTYKCFAENSLGSTEGSIKLYGEYVSFYLFIFSLIFLFLERKTFYELRQSFSLMNTLCCVNDVLWPTQERKIIWQWFPYFLCRLLRVKYLCIFTEKNFYSKFSF